MDDADGEVVGIAEGVLEVVLPGAWGAAVAAAGVGEVGEQVVDAVGDGAAVGFGGEVVVFDVGGAIVPGAAGIAEVADEFFLVGICWAPRYVELML